MYLPFARRSRDLILGKANSTAPVVVPSSPKPFRHDRPIPLRVVRRENVPVRNTHSLSKARFRLALSSSAPVLKLNAIFAQIHANLPKRGLP